MEIDRIDLNYHDRKTKISFSLFTFVYLFWKCSCHSDLYFLVQELNLFHLSSKVDFSDFQYFLIDCVVDHLKKKEQPLMIIYLSEPNLTWND